MSNVVFSNVHLNFSFDSDSLTSRIETILYLWAKQDLSDVFDKVFDDYDVGDTDIRLGNIDFDLGDVPEGFFLSETCSRLKEKLEQFLYPKLENQKQTACLKILINSCKKFAPEVATSKINEIFYSVYQTEESQETIIHKAIAILKRTYPALPVDEMIDDIFKEISIIEGKEKNIYLLNVLEKIYSSFIQEQEDTFIQTFLTSTIPHYSSDGYLDLLMHFVSEMQEKHPELNDIQRSENLFFNQPDDKISRDLKQIFNDICISALPGGSSAFINDFIQRIKESNPSITSLGITVLFIDELKKKYPHLNDFRLSNFDENQSPNLSKNYWKEEIKAILWDFYKSILQAGTASSESSVSEINEQNQESANISSDTQNKAENSDAESLSAENIEVTEAEVAETDSANINTSKSDSQESKADKNKEPLSESGDSEDSTSSEANEQSREGVDVADDTQDKAENSDVESSDAEDIETAETEAENFNVENIEVDETEAAERNAPESETLESNADNSKKLLSEPSDSENQVSETNKQNNENADASSSTQNKAESVNDENVENAEVETANNNAPESETLESKPGAPFKNEAAGANIPEQGNTENSAHKHSSFKANSTDIQTSENFDKIFNECFDEFSSSETKCSPLKITESFISKLQKEFPDQAVFDNVVKAYQKATELEMKYNSAAGKKDEILVKDAGLVLVGAYVPTLFKKLEYIVDGAFVSEQARLKACRLLRYIVFGDLPSDGLYFLGNYFCGLPWNFRIPKEIVLDDNEKKIAESLVMSIIENWKAIGHVSIDGFRGTFLHREGKIEKETDEEIYLKVKQGPFDMLLDRLPWSYSMLKFKWHKKLLSTIWR